MSAGLVPLFLASMKPVPELMVWHAVLLRVTRAGIDFPAPGAVSARATLCTVVVLRLLLTMLAKNDVRVYWIVTAMRSHCGPSYVELAAWVVSPPAVSAFMRLLPSGTGAVTVTVYPLTVADTERAASVERHAVVDVIGDPAASQGERGRPVPGGVMP